MSFRNLLLLIISSIIFLNTCTPDTNASPTQHPNSQTPTATHPQKAATPTTSITSTPIAESTFDGVRVTFIYFEGFLITIGDQRILIDALYKVHPRDVLQPIMESQPPFDGVDLILATHEHSDHFDPELVTQYLQNNPRTLFASNPKCVDTILAIDSSMGPRLTAIDLARGESEQLTIGDIDLEAIYLSHGIAGVLNLGFIISIDDVTLFHMGDLNPTTVSVSDLQTYGLPDKQIDIAFVNHRLFSDEKFYPLISEGIRADHIIPMHFSGKPPSDFESNFPNVRLLKEPYDSWVMP